MMFRNPEWMEMVADLFNFDISVGVDSKNKHCFVEEKFVENRKKKN